MRILAFLALFAFLLSGYSAAAHAFDACSCPRSMMTQDGMKDCCKHMSGKCGCSVCAPAAVQTLPPNPEIFLSPMVMSLIVAPDDIAASQSPRPGLRPPNLLA